MGFSGSGFDTYTPNSIEFNGIENELLSITDLEDDYFAFERTGGAEDYPSILPEGPVDITINFTGGSGSLTIPDAMTVIYASFTPDTFPSASSVAIQVSGTYLLPNEVEYIRIVLISTFVEVPVSYYPTVINSTTLSFLLDDGIDPGEYCIQIFYAAGGTYNSVGPQECALYLFTLTIT